MEECTDSCHVTHIISHIVGNGGGIPGIILRYACVYLSDQIRSHISGFGIDASADPGKESHGTGAHAKASDDASSLDRSRPQAVNPLGAPIEMKGDRIEAQKNYRTALSLDPSYEPAIKNLQRSKEGKWKQTGPILLGGHGGGQINKFPGL